MSQLYKWYILIGKDLYEIKKSLQFVPLLLIVPITYQEVSLMFIGKSYPIFFISILVISILLFFSFPCGLFLILIHFEFLIIPLKKKTSTNITSMLT